MASHPRPVPIPGTTAHPITGDDIVDYPSPAEGLPPLTATPDDTRNLAKRLAAGTGPIAVDAERASGFRYGQDAYLIQLRRTRVGSALVDPTTCGPLDALAAAMDGPEWILHAADQDLPCLRALGLTPAALFDTELAARILGREHVGLGAVLEETLGLRLKKDHAAADWSTRPLPETWLIYAALDVELLIELRDALWNELCATGRDAWALAEFEYVRTAPPRAPKLDPWRKTPKSGTVRTPRSLAILRELWIARENLAQELDVTPSKVLPHAALVQAAVARPTSRRKLQHIREFQSRQARLNFEVWWRAVEHAMALPDEELPSRHAPTPEGELPPQRTWKHRHPHAARALETVKYTVRTQAENIAIPQEILLEPLLQRRLAWYAGEADKDQRPRGLNEARVRELLSTWGAREWQVGLVSSPLAQALA